MKAEQELWQVYREWRRLALAVGRAIQTRNWNLLADCHAAIEGYQTLAVRLTRDVRAEWQRVEASPAEKEQTRQAVVADLLELTRQNQSRMQSAVAHARAKLEQLSEVETNLKRLRRAYGGLANGSPPR